MQAKDRTFSLKQSASHFSPSINPISEGVDIVPWKDQALAQSAQSTHSLRVSQVGLIATNNNVTYVCILFIFKKKSHQIN